MQQSPVWSSQNELINSPDDILRRLILVEDQLRFINQSQQQYFLQGRTRNERTIPTSSTDVNQYDEAGDQIFTTTGLYVLTSNPVTNSLEWILYVGSTF